MLDFKDEVLEILKKNNFYYNQYGAVYFHPNIPQKIIINVRKKITQSINMHSVVAIIDYSIFKDGVDVLIFTTHGVYMHDSFTKKFYFNYVDFSRIDYDKNNYTLYLNNDEIFSASTLGFDMGKFEAALRQLNKYAKKHNMISVIPSGDVKKQEMPKDMQKKCHGFIHTATAVAGASGFFTAKVASITDTVIITPAQIAMIIGLGSVFDLHITESVAKSILAGYAAVKGGKYAANALFWALPPVIDGAANAITSISITECLGWSAAYQFYNEYLDNKNKFGYEGEKNACIEVSQEYETKFRNQAELFKKQL